MTQRYGDERSKAEALKQMLADLMMDSPGNGEGGYVARLKRSVLSESSSWAAVDYDSRQHHAYCEVRTLSTSSARTTHTYICN